MKIIKKGDPAKLITAKRFECCMCGCVFEADKDEYKCSMQYNETYFYCKCPFCGASAPVKENVR